ncbi:DUF6907 domain-containing protein [Streptomyces scabiei]|uniref:DUF6907 domain-containing protein n=1 Tax=Streptomyces scabiei TaxID=1930 RepID=UPI0038F7AA2A
MSAPRTVTVHTVDHGPLTLPEPSWCAGAHEDGGARVDITHVGTEHVLTLPTRRGPVVSLSVSLESRPFAGDSFLRRPFASVEVGGDVYPTGLAGLEAMADALAEHAEELRDRARELAVVLAEGRLR